MARAEAFCDRIDAVNQWTGKIVSMLFLPLVGIVTLEVVLRYFFNKPTIWAWDVNVQLAAAIAIMAGGYGLLYGSHVTVDVMVGHLTSRARARADLVTSALFFFVMAILLWVAVSWAERSVSARELYTSLLEPPLYPLRIVVAIGIFLLLMQGMAKFIRDLAIATGPE